MLLHHVPRTGSTSDDLRVLAEDGAPEQALLATVQFGGRGRLGRTWSSPPGNLHLSVLLRPPAPLQPGHWSLLAAVALAEALRPLVPAIRLKWPNDLLLGGGKLAGILLEAGSGPAGQGPWLVIGFGVNLVAAPPGLGRPVSRLADHAPPPEPALLARSLLATLHARRTAYGAQGFEPVRRSWLALGPAEGDPVSVNAAGGRIQGRFRGIAPSGALLLETADGAIQTLLSGEVEL